MIKWTSVTCNLHEQFERYYYYDEMQPENYLEDYDPYVVDMPETLQVVEPLYSPELPVGDE